MPLKRERIPSIDILRGLVMLLMALDHTRMYFGYGTWYSEPTNLTATTPLLFLTRWITHFCAPVFVLLAGTSAYIWGTRKTKNELALYLFTRGLWLIFTEVVIVNFAWTFDITYSFIILQVLWAIGLSMIFLSALVYLPVAAILLVGLTIIFGHNLLDPITVNGNGFGSLLWYTFHQQQFLILDTGKILNFVYPVLPWVGLMAIGYALGVLYQTDTDASARKKRLIQIGVGSVFLFLILRGFNLYGEPIPWSEQSTSFFTLISFLNTSKYPPSLQFLLMTVGPSLIFLSISERTKTRSTNLFSVFGKVPFFFYIVHLYLIHILAIYLLVLKGRDWHEYILSAEGIRSGSLSNFGLGLEAVYGIWILVIAILYPICIKYLGIKTTKQYRWWPGYL